MSQWREKRYVLRRVKKLKHTHGGTEQPNGRLANDKALTMSRGWYLWNIIAAQNFRTIGMSRRRKIDSSGACSEASMIWL